MSGQGVPAGSPEDTTNVGAEKFDALLQQHLTDPDGAGRAAKVTSRWLEDWVRGKSNVLSTGSRSMLLRVVSVLNACAGHLSDGDSDASS